jgi:hypothetical protein
VLGQSPAGGGVGGLESRGRDGAESDTPAFKNEDLGSSGDGLPNG